MSSRPTPSRATRIWTSGVWLGLIACCFYLGVEVFLLGSAAGFPLDDSWIHLQFARNLAAGDGLSFNAGELVPGSTAPLWTALLSLAFLLPGGEVFWVKLSGIVLYLLAGFITWKLGRELGLDRGWATLGAITTQATSWLVWSALSGLEIPLFVVLSLGGILLHLRERKNASRLPLSLPVLAMSFLARPEGALLILAAVADRLLVFGRDSRGRLRWRPPSLHPLWLGLALILIVVTPVLVFNLFVSGSLLPTTFGAKSGGVARMLPEMGYLYTVFGIFFQAQPWTSLLATAGALILVFQTGGRNDCGLLPVLWLFGLPLAYGLIDRPGPFSLVGNFGRYYFPLFPLVVVLGILAIASAARLWRQRGTLQGPGPLALTLALSLLLLPTLTALVKGGGRYAQSVANVQSSDVQAARWLAPRLPPEAVLGVGDIGAIKFLLPNRVVDLAGIVHPEIRSLGPQRFLDHHRPDYLVIYPNWLQRLVDDVASFPVIEEFPIPDNITMAGDVLVVYGTPWTRYPLREPTSGGRP